MSNSISKVPNKYDLAKETLVLILAGGRGSRLYELTDKRAKPALYFGGNRRIIDFALSNCLNSNLNRIGVITQYAAHSLLRHLQTGWSFLPQERGEFIDMLPARQQIDDNTWYRGTADAVYQNMAIIRNHYRPKYILILAGDHIYKMDYSQMLLDHVNSGAKCTVGCIEVPREDAREFGVMAVVTPNTSHDFGKDVIPMALEDGVLYAHPFDRSCMGRNTDGAIYWRDVGTLDSFWQSNIDLVSEEPQLDIYDQSWPIRGNPAQTYPSKFFYDSGACKQVDNSLISGGCIVRNASISYSVLFDNIKINDGSTIEYSVVLPQVTVGKDCVLKRCIIDRHVTIPDGMQIGVDLELDSKRFRVSKGGIVLVTASMLQKLQGETVSSESHLD